MDLSKLYAFMDEKKITAHAKMTIQLIMTKPVKVTPEVFANDAEMTTMARHGLIKLTPAAPGVKTLIVATNYAKRIAAGE